jgi:hypothetical protein
LVAQVQAMIHQGIHAKQVVLPLGVVILQAHLFY